MASRKHTTAAMIVKVPSRSICKNFSRRVAFTGRAAGVASTGHPSCTSTGYSSSNNEGGAIFRDRADQRSQLEDEDREHEGGFEWKIFVCLSPGRLERSNGEKEGGGIPSHLIQGIELI